MDFAAQPSLITRVDENLLLSPKHLRAPSGFPKGDVMQWHHVLFLVLPEYRQPDVRFIVAQRKSQMGKKWKSVGQDQLLPDVPMCLRV